MGVTIESKNHSIDLGYIGFNLLRRKVAELTAEDIGVHYKELSKVFCYFGDERAIHIERYNRKITELSEKYNGEKDGILHFLYAADTDGEMPVEICKEIYEVIKDYDDDILYGYSGRPDCAKFKDFKELVKDCIDNDCTMKWF